MVLTKKLLQILRSVEVQSRIVSSELKQIENLLKGVENNFQRMSYNEVATAIKKIIDKINKIS